MHAETGKVQPVGIDDACMFLAVFANGSMGTFESTRYARGRKNFNTFELNGEAGSVYFDLEDPQYLAVLQIRRSQDRREDRRPPDRLAEDPRHQLRAPLHEATGGCPAARSATSTRSSTPWPISWRAWRAASRSSPTSAARLRTQKVCDAVLASAKSGKWVEIA